MEMLDNSIVSVWGSAPDKYLKAKASDLNPFKPRQDLSRTISTALQTTITRFTDPSHTPKQARTFSDAHLWSLAHDKELRTLDQILTFKWVLNKKNHNFGESDIAKNDQPLQALLKPRPVPEVSMLSTWIPHGTPPPL